MILGTVQLGMAYGVNNTIGQPDRETAFQILDSAYASGVRRLDTAPAYGTAEEVIGAYHRESRNRFTVCTKLPVDILRMDGSAKNAILSGYHVEKNQAVQRVYIPLSGTVRSADSACPFRAFALFKKRENVSGQTH